MSRLLLSVLLLGACSTRYEVLTPTDTGSAAEGPDEDGAALGDTGGFEDTGEVDDALWSSASLLVLSPASGFYPVEDPVHLEAQVVDADGNPLDFDEISWSSSLDPDWSAAGTSLDEFLPVGEHVITATAVLPNGDRLAYAVGGVLVQSVYAGTYTGTLTVDASFEYNGVPYTSSCAGGATVVVDAEGRTVSGDSDCVLSLMGYELDTAFLVDAENDGGELSGAISADLSWFTWDFDSTGQLSEDGQLSLSFSDELYGYLQLEGSMELERVSRDTTVD